LLSNQPQIEQPKTSSENDRLTAGEAQSCNGKTEQGQF
jgi:hypothetical protein